MIRSMTRKVHSRSLYLTNTKRLIIIEKLRENILIFLSRNAISLTEQLLHLTNPLSNTDRWPMTLFRS